MKYTGCNQIDLANGDIRFSDGLLVDSVATHTCNRANGYVFRSEEEADMLTRTCGVEGWSGSDITCQCKLPRIV